MSERHTLVAEQITHPFCRVHPNMCLPFEIQRGSEVVQTVSDVAGVNLWLSCKGSELRYSPLVEENVDVVDAMPVLSGDTHEFFVHGAGELAIQQDIVHHIKETRFIQDKTEHATVKRLEAAPQTSTTDGINADKYAYQRDSQSGAAW